MSNIKKYNFEKSNSCIIEYRNTESLYQPILLKYENIAEYYTEEPNILVVLEKKDKKEKTYEQIMRIRFWIPNKKVFSWILYARDRDLIKAEKYGFVLRHIVWDREADVIRLKKNGRKEMLEDFPRITSNTTYIYSKNATKLMQVLKKESSFYQEGMLMKERRNQHEITWRDLEYYRTFDWGSINLIFSMEKENKYLEKYIFECNKIFEFYMNSGEEKIEKIILEYDNLPKFIEK